VRCNGTAAKTAATSTIGSIAANERIPTRREIDDIKPSTAIGMPRSRSNHRAIG
jgi:hypothetical protein